MPDALQSLQRQLLRRTGGDRVMAHVLATVQEEHGLEAVIVATEIVLESSAQLSPPGGGLPYHEWFIEFASPPADHNSSTRKEFRRISGWSRQPALSRASQYIFNFTRSSNATFGQLPIQMSCVCLPQWCLDTYSNFGSP